MHAKFAKAIAANIRIMAEAAARIQVIDSLKVGDVDNACARAESVRELERAEHRLAALLIEPGAKLDLGKPADLDYQGPWKDGIQRK